MTAEEASKCITSVEIARYVANSIHCLTEAENADIDNVVNMLAAYIIGEKDPPPVPA